MVNGSDMSKYIIEGGYPLIGKVKLSGAKNAGFKAMIAGLLSDETLTLSNVSFVNDIQVVREIVKTLGGGVNLELNHKVSVSGAGLRSYEIPEEFGGNDRISSMMIGPLLYWFGKAILPYPGGDRIGKRPIDRHILGLKGLGIKIEEKGNYFHASARKLKGTNFRFSKNTHTGTETLLLCAVFAEGRTVLENASAEPEVDDLIKVLCLMGAKIKRIKKRAIEIEGVKNFRTAKHSIMPDRNEAVTFACMALGTKGDVLIEEAVKEHLLAFIQKVTEAGGGVEYKANGIRFFTKGILNSTYVETDIHPGFMTDWQPLWTTLMTQAKGESTVVERVFENRFGFVEDLKLMGANMELYNPKIRDPKTFYEFNYDSYEKKDPYFHAARIYGPTKLVGVNTNVTDIRSGATLVLASLMASGRAEISGVEHIERGYENLEGKLRCLGAKIYKD